MKAQHASDRGEGARLELQLEPIAPLALSHLEDRRLAARADENSSGLSIDIYRDIEPDVLFHLRIPWPDDVRGEFRAAVQPHRHHVLALARLDRLARARVEGRSSQASTKIRHPHAGEHASLQLVRRIRARTAQHDRRDARLG